MSQEMFLRKIPEDMQPWECNVNGVKYVYPAGTEQEVPEEVAHLIDAWYAAQEQESVPGGGDARLVVDAVWDYETDPNTLTLSKTFEEVANAFNAGKEVVLRENGSFIYPLAAVYDEEAVFTSIAPVNETSISSYNYSLKPGGTWKYWDNSWSATVGITITNDSSSPAE